MSRKDKPKKLSTSREYNSRYVFNLSGSNPAWHCMDCGALVASCSTHNIWHAKQTQ